MAAEEFGEVVATDSFGRARRRPGFYPCPLLSLPGAEGVAVEAEGGVGVVDEDVHAAE